jgi:hypothetical protein
MRRFFCRPLGLAALTVALSCSPLALATPALAHDGVTPALAPDDVVHACVHRWSRYVRIVGRGRSCRDSEQHVQWSVAGPQGKAGPPGAPGPQGVPGPPGEGDAAGAGVLLLDNLGNTIGTLLGCCDVVVEAEGAKVLLPVVAGGFAETPVLFYYESADCSGPRRLPRNGVFSSTVVQGTTAFYATDFERRPILSQESAAGCFTIPFLPPTGLASSLDLSGFVPPFSVR